jgi:hypothetical protein
MNRSVRRRASAALVAAAAVGLFVLGWSSGPKEYAGPAGCSLLTAADVNQTELWAKATRRGKPIERSENSTFSDSTPLQRLPARVTRTKVKVGATCLYRFGRVEDAFRPKGLASLSVTVSEMRFVSPEWSTSLSPLPTIPAPLLDGLGEPRAGQVLVGADGTTTCSVAQQLGNHILMVSEFGMVPDCTDTVRLARSAGSRLRSLDPTS